MILIISGVAHLSTYGLHCPYGISLIGLLSLDSSLLRQRRSGLRPQRNTGLLCIPLAVFYCRLGVFPMLFTKKRAALRSVVVVAAWNTGSIFPVHSFFLKPANYFVPDYCRSHLLLGVHIFYPLGQRERSINRAAVILNTAVPLTDISDTAPSSKYFPEGKTCCSIFPLLKFLRKYFLLRARFECFLLKGLELVALLPSLYPLFGITRHLFECSS